MLVCALALASFPMIFSDTSNADDAGFEQAVSLTDIKPTAQFIEDDPCQTYFSFESVIDDYNQVLNLPSYYKFDKIPGENAKMSLGTYEKFENNVHRTVSYYSYTDDSAVLSYTFDSDQRMFDGTGFNLEYEDLIKSIGYDSEWKTGDTIEIKVNIDKYAYEEKCYEFEAVSGASGKYYYKVSEQKTGELCDFTATLKINGKDFVLKRHTSGESLITSCYDSDMSDLQIGDRVIEKLKIEVSPHDDNGTYEYDGKSYKYMGNTYYWDYEKFADSFSKIEYRNVTNIYRYYMELPEKSTGGAFDPTFADTINTNYGYTVSNDVNAATSAFESISDKISATPDSGTNMVFFIAGAAVGVLIVAGLVILFLKKRKA